MNIRIGEVKDTLPYHVNSALDVSNYMTDYRRADREIFFAMYLNAKSFIISVEPSSVGSLDFSHVYMREVIKGALIHSASRIILIHNHPSGDCAPSPDDNKTTSSIVLAGKLMQIQVLDHIIIGNSYYSYAEAGLIDKYEREAMKLLDGLS